LTSEVTISHAALSILDNFAADLPSVAIPTMTEWCMIIFIALAGLGSVYYLRRQRRA